jgi:hypothetical protein
MPQKYGFLNDKRGEIFKEIEAKGVIPQKNCATVKNKVTENQCNTFVLAVGDRTDFSILSDENTTSLTSMRSWKI